ncbi:major facilitator superfamily domain-containing protein [Spinellus fusiger]|nr:major facilitator superfamily domain-containing protein [Spinellus fusiger]
MIVISIVLFSEPLTSTILFPFIYFMVKDFHLSDDEKEIGTYAGWIASVFFVAQFSTAILWGRISDKYGRRPVLLTGLLGNIISSSMFGLSKSLWWALASRAFCGIVNGNGGAARSMLSEITDSTNRAKAFSIFGFCWGMGMIAGPAIGGYLCNPVEQFPGLFGNSLFLKEYPYFLPCFVSSLGSLVGYIIGFIYLKESNPMVIARRNREDLTKNEETGTIHSLDEENSALLNTQKRASTLYKTFSSDNQHGTNTASISTKPDTVSQSLLKSIPMSSYIVALAYSIFGFHSMVFDEVLPLYFLAPSYAGGLGSTSVEFARALSIVGIQQLFCQFVVYPKLCRHFSILKMTRVCFFILTPIYLLFPELTTYKGWLEASVGDEVARQWAFRSVYMLILSLRYFMNSVCFTSLMIMVSNSASPEILGTVNG